MKVNDDIEFLIWKSGFGINRERRQYWESQPVIPSSFADIICKKFKNLKIFGFDMISLTSKLDREEGKRIHEKFLCEYKILIIEDMNLLRPIYTETSAYGHFGRENPNFSWEKADILQS